MANAFENVFTKVVSKYFSGINPLSQFLKVLTVVNRRAVTFYKKVIGIETEQNLVPVQVIRQLYEQIE